jgi:hypothetical protein
MNWINLLMSNGSFFKGAVKIFNSKLALHTFFPTESPCPMSKRCWFAHFLWLNQFMWAPHLNVSGYEGSFCVKFAILKNIRTNARWLPEIKHLKEGCVVDVKHSGLISAEQKFSVCFSENSLEAVDHLNKFLVFFDVLASWQIDSKEWVQVLAIVFNLDSQLCSLDRILRK